jgi:deoxyadenosine/deoxycytidine kinase
MPRNSNILTIVGNVASGKSSAVPLLARALQAKPIFADDLFQTIDPFAEDFLKDTPRWAFTNELWLTLERAKIMRRALDGQQTDWLVVDSGLLMSWVYTYSHYLVGKISLDEWKLYADLYDELTADLLGDMTVVMLQYKTETLLNRLKIRGRSYELEFYTRDYLEQLDMGLTELRIKLRAQLAKVIIISEAEVADFVKHKEDEQRLVGGVLAEVGELNSREVVWALE